ncbi:MAG TPA: YciI family protein [Pseudolysinimonas sp.]
MPSFVFIYRAGSDPVPTERVPENRAAWREWNEALHEDYGIRTATGKLVTAEGVTDSDGVVRGASMVEFDTMDAALAVAKNAPNLAFGGSVEVLEELPSAQRG